MENIHSFVFYYYLYRSKLNDSKDPTGLKPAPILPNRGTRALPIEPRIESADPSNFFIFVINFKFKFENLIFFNETNIAGLNKHKYGIFSFIPLTRRVHHYRQSIIPTSQFARHRSPPREESSNILRGLWTIFFMVLSPCFPSPLHRFIAPKALQML